MVYKALKMIVRRSRQVRRLWGYAGSQGVLDQLRRAIAKQILPVRPSLPVRWADILSADVTKCREWFPLPIDGQKTLLINWVTTPPGAGSGGHTTMFRLIQHLEQSGYICKVYIYDVYGGDAAYHASRVRELYPKFSGEVKDVTMGMADAHAVVATSWQTAYPVYNDQCRGRRFYLVQDFEPWFYPAGSLSILAENTYRMGFHAITAGRFLAEKLKAEYRVAADAFDFGCDTETYNLSGKMDNRDGIVFYARPSAARRAFELGLMALQIFSKRHPNLAIHFYGDRIGKAPFRFVDHGTIGPDELNKLYNRCFAGLSLSMTNVSLVPHEMLSAGCIPVVNEASHNRIVLNNSFVRYALPTPHALAHALTEVVERKDFCALASAASASVLSVSWEAAGRAVERCLRKVINNSSA